MRSLEKNNTKVLCGVTALVVLFILSVRFSSFVSGFFEAKAKQFVANEYSIHGVIPECTLSGLCRARWFEQRRIISVYVKCEPFDQCVIEVVTYQNRSGKLMV